MTLQECYQAMEADYEGAIGRLGERILKKFAVKFLNDGSYALLQTSMAEGNIPEAFRAAHTIKGVCLNLGFAKLAASSGALTEALRAENMEEAQQLLPQTAADYEMTIAAIRQLDDLPA